MAYDDQLHREVADALLGELGLSPREASKKEDIDSVGDIFIKSKSGVEMPVGLKDRGEKSLNDYNLTAWSQMYGDLPEFANAGGKFYLYWMKHGSERHQLVLFNDQKKLDAYLPDQWIPLRHGERWKWSRRPYAGVRDKSRNSNVPQGVVFVPATQTTLIAEWDSDLNLTFLDQNFYDLFVDIN